MQAPAAAGVVGTAEAIASQDGGARAGSMRRSPARTCAPSSSGWASIPPRSRAASTRCRRRSRDARRPDRRGARRRRRARRDRHRVRGPDHPRARRRHRHLQEDVNRSALAIATLAVALAGCATSPPLADGLPASAPRTIELDATPFFPQEDYQCGPAALATLLVASGVDVAPESLAPEVYLPERRGSLSLELVGAARRHGRLPYVLATTAEEMVEELEAGRPVLVLQNLGVSQAAALALRRAHRLRRGPQRRPAALRSRTAPRDEVAALCRHLAPRRALRDDDLARRAKSRITRSLHAYIAAAAGLEAAGQRRAAATAYDAAIARWPRRTACLARPRQRRLRGWRPGRRSRCLVACDHAGSGRCGSTQQPRGAPAGGWLPRRVAPANRTRLRARAGHNARIHGLGKPNEDRRDRARSRALPVRGADLARLSGQAFGGTLALSRNRFVGSYLALSAISRSRFCP